jgi:cytochrome d ubiquinol oxidase subunit II
MQAERLLGAAMLAALLLYVLMAGADFGGGVWDLLALGPRKGAQRKLIEKALGPIWEANHVWLILAVVLLFAAFPPAFAAISIALHIPLTLFLVGVVFRGSAFTFRAYDDRGDAQQKRWGLLFSLASVASPILLGTIVGAVASGGIRVEKGVVLTGFFASWLRPFPIIVGFFALGLCAFLAAVYLAREAQVSEHGSPELVLDFRRRALLAGAFVGVCALAAFASSIDGAPLISAGLRERPFTWPLHAATAAAAITTFWALYRHHIRLARFTVVAQATFILLGWAASQYPYLLVPDFTLDSCAANPKTQELLLVALGAGSLLLFPSLLVLYRIFKR